MSIVKSRANKLDSLVSGYLINIGAAIKYIPVVSGYI